MDLAMAFSACCRECRATGQIGSNLMVSMTVSTIELSSQAGVVPMQPMR
ncbi:hypothetical protein [uncultured Paracoccus sp.]|nr:hypothetical protein [uncultured Paracoccus sp.]